MGNLLASLTTAAASMRAFERALSVVQNNVTNASTPGYAKQRVELTANRFQPDLLEPGGVTAGSLLTARSAYAEQAVWRQAERYGRYAQLAAGLTQVEPVFDIGEGSGIAGALDRLYQSFSQWSITPNDIPARQNVISRAEDVARAFNFSAASLFRVTEHTEREIRSEVEAINRLAGRIRDLNAEMRRDFRKQLDAGIDAQLHAVLEELSELADFTALRQEDGTASLFLAGQVPLVIGENLYEIRTDFSSPQAGILDYNGKDVSELVRDGRLKALLEMKNSLLPSYASDLNRLAETLAERMNEILLGGVDANGQAPVMGLFTFESVNGSALTLSVTAITPAELAAALPSAPGGNGNALLLVGLAASREIDGFTLTESYGRLGARVGRALATAREEERTQGLLLAQARTMRSEISSVSLDEEAVKLVQFQRAYQASAQLLSVLNELTDTLLGIMR